MPGYFDPLPKSNDAARGWSEDQLRVWLRSQTISPAQIRDGALDVVGALGVTGDSTLDGALALNGVLTYGNIAAGGNTDSRTFTNTSYLDLDALTGGAGTIAAVSCSAATSTRALIIVSCSDLTTSTTGAALLSFRVSGATTLASDDTRVIKAQGVAGETIGVSRVFLLSSLTAGTNVFELQARVSAGVTGTLNDPSIVVIPI